MGLLKFSEIFYKTISREIPFNQISIDKESLRQESFKYIEGFFDGDTYPNELSPVELVVYKTNPQVIHVYDGRHRLITARKFGVKNIPAVLISINEDGEYEAEDEVTIV